MSPAEGSCEPPGGKTRKPIANLPGSGEPIPAPIALARKALQPIKLLARASRLLTQRTTDGVDANREQCERRAELTLAAVTAPNAHIGSDRVSLILQEAASSGRSLREVAREGGVDEAILDEALDHRAMAKPHPA